MKTPYYLAIGTLAASALAGTLVYASQYGERDRTALPEYGLPTISLAQAVAIAERHAQGQAIEAEFEQRDGRGFYEVEVATARNVVEVKVDSDNGNVIGDRADRVDDDADQDKRDRS